MNDVNLKTFPTTKRSALTMLFLEKTFDFEVGTPEELARAYEEVYERIDTEMNK